MGGGGGEDDLDGEELQGRRLSEEEMRLARRPPPAKSTSQRIVGVSLLAICIAAIGWCGVAFNNYAEGRQDRPTTTITARHDSKAYSYCRDRGHEQLAAELGMPADELSDIAFEYALKVKRATSDQEAIDAASSCLEGLVAATGFGS